MKRLAIAFSGPSNTGKTTLICKVAQIFIEQNLKVAIVKHDPKDKAKFDTEGKDSAKFSAVGADVAVVSPTRTTYFLKQMRNLDEIIAGFGDFDILIVEEEGIQGNIEDPDMEKINYEKEKDKELSKKYV